MGADNFPGAGTFFFCLLASTEYRTQKHEQGITTGHGADHIDRIGEISAKPGDRLKPRIIELCEHKDGLAKRRPKSKADLKVAIKKVKTDYPINKRKRQCSQQC